MAEPAPEKNRNDSSDEEVYENASSDIRTLPPDESNEAIIDNLIGKQANLDLHDEPSDDEDNPPPVTQTSEDEAERIAYEKTLTPEQLRENKLKAVEFKTAGNAQFKSEEFLASIESYTAGLDVCPLDCTEERSILFGNRAAAHIQLANKSLAIQDCTDSIAYNPKYVRVLLRLVSIWLACIRFVI